jgi:hypothetical protein
MHMYYICFGGDADGHLLSALHHSNRVHDDIRLWSRRAYSVPQRGVGEVGEDDLRSVVPTHDVEV